MPRFEDYPATEIYRGTPAILKPAGPMALKYVADIREEEDSQANFAGHLIVVKWSCGSPCVRMAIIDARTGEIYFPPITFGGASDQSFDLPSLWPQGSVSRNPGVQFRPDSNLMIVQATPSLKGKHPSSKYYFLWKHGRWVLLRREPLVDAYSSQKN